LEPIIQFIQKLVAADKTVLVAAAVQAAVSLVAGLGFHLDGAAVGVISALIAAGLGWFVNAHFALKLAAKHAAE
jgi:hypothetical protein